MNRLTFGSVVCVLAIGITGCGGDPFADDNAAVDKIVATPARLFVAQGRPEFVVVEVVSPLGGAQAATDFGFTNAGQGITVVRDPDFNVLTTGGALDTRARFIVTGNDLVSTSFTVTASDTSLVIPVRVVPVTLQATFSNTAPALGEVVTITAPSGARFDPTATIVTPGGPAPANVTIAADGSSISFLPGPNVNGPVQIAGVVVAYLGTLTLNTSQSLVTPVVTNFVGTFSTTTPNINDQVTLTLDPAFQFAPTAEVSFQGSVSTLTTVAGGGGSLTFRAPTAGAGLPIVSGVIATSLPQIVLTLPADDTVFISSTVIPLAGTGSAATAPTLEIPSSGQSATLVDAGTPFGADPGCFAVGGFNCRLYTFTLAADQDVDFSGTWNSSTDLGLYITDAAFSGSLSAFDCDGHGAGAGNQPEECTVSLTAGTYFVEVVTFAPFYSPPDNVDPTQIQLVISSP